MRMNMASALIVTAALGLGSAAFAATNTAGTIKSIDAKAGSVTLQDGTVYMLPAGFKLDTFKAGEKVSISWDLKGSLHEIVTMKAS